MNFFLSASGRLIALLKQKPKLYDNTYWYQHWQIWIRRLYFSFESHILSLSSMKYRCAEWLPKQKWCYLWWIHTGDNVELVWIEALQTTEAVWPGKMGLAKREKLEFQKCYSSTGKSFSFFITLSFQNIHIYLNVSAFLKFCKVLQNNMQLTFKITHTKSISLWWMLHALWSAVSEKLCKLNNYLWYGTTSFIDCTWGKNLATCIETVNKFQHVNFPVQQLVRKEPFMQEE